MKDGRNRVFIVTILVLGFSLMVIPVANAYIDASSGSYIIQMVVGAFLGITLTVRVFWHRIISFFTGRNRAEQVEQEEQQSSPK
jgi:hypothetical protein